MVSGIFKISRPETGEYDSFYQGYLDSIVLDWKEVMDRQPIELAAFLSELDNERLKYRYAEGKWSIAEVLGHINDVERLMGYRAMCFGRGDEQPLPGFEQDDYVINGHFNLRDKDDFLEEFKALRKSNLYLFQSFDQDDLVRKGTAWGKGFTVRALAYIIIGHCQHHLNILVSRYRMNS